MIFHTSETKNAIRKQANKRQGDDHRNPNDFRFFGEGVGPDTQDSQDHQGDPKNERCIPNLRNEVLSIKPKPV